MHLIYQKKNYKKISLNFGSDIAFFFENKSSIIKGRGELIKNFPSFEPISALLVNPKIHLSTKEIFDNLGQDYADEIANEKLLQRDVFYLTKSLINSLEKPAIKAAPEIAKIITNLTENGANIAKMSGSGSSCFGIFTDEKSLEQAEIFFKKNFAEFFVKKIKILSQKI